MPENEDKNGLKRSNIKKIEKKRTAVALSEGLKKGLLPSITASGRGEIADRIVQLAYDNDIKVREDSALAEMLVSFDVDSPIPSEAFTAIAEIMSYLYRANGEQAPFDAILSHMRLLDDDEPTEEAE
jgi:flagellar biosynthesis protein